MAIVVADDWHRRGVGSALTESLADEARRLEQHHAGSGVDELVLDLAA